MRFRATTLNASLLFMTLGQGSLAFPVGNDVIGRSTVPDHSSRQRQHDKPADANAGGIPGLGGLTAAVPAVDSLTSRGDEPPADEPPADEPPADEPPADEPPADEPPADEPPADEANAGIADGFAAGPSTDNPLVGRQIEVDDFDWPGTLDGSLSGRQDTSFGESHTPAADPGTASRPGGGDESATGPLNSRQVLDYPGMPGSHYDEQRQNEPRANEPDLTPSSDVDSAPGPSSSRRPIVDHVLADD